MPAPQRAVTAVMALSLALLVAGGVGAATHGSSAGRPSQSAPARPGVVGPIVPGSGVPASIPPTGVAPPPPGSGALAAGLITPTDMGGYYRVTPAAADTFLASAACLAAWRGSPAPTGQAETALLGPDSYSMPTIIEEVASYPPQVARTVYASVVAGLGRCPALSFALFGAPVRAPIRARPIPPVGDADQVWAGDFSYAGAPFTVQIGVVLDGSTVLAVAWMDAVPAAPAVMGGFTSTVSLAIGKLA